LIVEWEGPDALEPIEKAATQEPETTTEDIKTQTKQTEKPAQAEESEESETEWKKRQQRPSPAEVSESSDDESGDEYVDHGEEASRTRLQRKVRRCVLSTAEAPRCSQEILSRQRPNNRRIAAMSSSDSEEEGDKEKTAATDANSRRASIASAKAKRISASPQLGTLKRKQSTSVAATAAAPSAAKRKRAESTASATEDAARKYCLGKYTEMFTGIFMQYPYVQQEDHAQAEAENGEGEKEHKKVMLERKPEELTEEEKAKVREGAKAFAAEVEQAVFDVYAEPDKYGKPSASTKYKYVHPPGKPSARTCTDDRFTGSASVRLLSTCSSPTGSRCTGASRPGKLRLRRCLRCPRQSSRRGNSRSQSSRPSRRPSSIPS
jgi:hypothetical protein